MCSTGLIFTLRVLGLRVPRSNPTVTNREIFIRSEGCCSEKLYVRGNSVLPLVARDSGIWQTPTLDDSDMSSRAVESILIYFSFILREHLWSLR